MDSGLDEETKDGVGLGIVTPPKTCKGKEVAFAVDDEKFSVPDTSVPNLRPLEPPCKTMKYKA